MYKKYQFYKTHLILIGPDLKRSISIVSGEWLLSPNGEYMLRMQGDGNLVVYKDRNTAVWSSKTGQSVCPLQAPQGWIGFHTSVQSGVKF